MMRRAFLVAAFGTAESEEAQRIGGPDFGEANKCLDGHYASFPTSVRRDFRSAMMVQAVRLVNGITGSLKLTDSLHSP
jgi:hypothetical protein